MEKPTAKKNKKIYFPGMRVAKTVIAVYICFLLSFYQEDTPLFIQL